MHSISTEPITEPITKPVEATPTVTVEEEKSVTFIRINEEFSILIDFTNNAKVNINDNAIIIDGEKYVPDISSEYEYEIISSNIVGNRLQVDFLIHKKETK